MHFSPCTSASVRSNFSCYRRQCFSAAGSSSSSELLTSTSAAPGMMVSEWLVPKADEPAALAACGAASSAEDRAEDGCGSEEDACVMRPSLCGAASSCRVVHVGLRCAS